ncbi:hypothetical protein AVEN_23055-1 [Araneus ventricosus]|uniref:Uncharacterized protein n=1 Tax=Araneus ventricosus TaxID=182803 RepID=A0A4Y2Q1P1_ARAVE|nr:hypothetical protein AVEN_23055-1 [Araneus ventricosus]
MADSDRFGVYLAQEAPEELLTCKSQAVTLPYRSSLGQLNEGRHDSSGELRSNPNGHRRPWPFRKQDVPSSEWR